MSSKKHKNYNNNQNENMEAELPIITDKIDPVVNNSIIQPLVDEKEIGYIKDFENDIVVKPLPLFDEEKPGYIKDFVNDNHGNMLSARKNFNGGMLTGQAIIDAVKNGEIIISDFDIKNVNPNSYNMRLGNTLKVYTETVLDPRKKNTTKEIIIPEKGLILKPGELYLGTTIESCGGNIYIPQIDGRSSYGRLGLEIHITAGFGDLGFNGTWTLEMTVVRPLIVYPNTEICQICWFTPYGPTDIKYDGRYQGQQGTTESRVEMNKKVYIDD